MTSLRRLMKRLAKDTRGATIVEYGLIAAVVSLGLLGALTVFGDALWNIYTDIILNMLRNAAGG